MFLEKDGSFTVCHCHIQALAVVMCKLYNNPSEAAFCDIFVWQENKYNFSRYRVWNTESKVGHFGQAIRYISKLVHTQNTQNFTQNFSTYAKFSEKQRINEYEI